MSCPAYPDKFIRDDVVAPSVLVPIVIVTLPSVEFFYVRESDTAVGVELRVCVDLLNSDADGTGACISAEVVVDMPRSQQTQLEHACFVHAADARPEEQQQHAGERQQRADLHRWVQGQVQGQSPNSGSTACRFVLSSSRLSASSGGGVLNFHGKSQGQFKVTDKTNESSKSGSNSRSDRYSFNSSLRHSLTILRSFCWLVFCTNEPLHLTASSLSLSPFAFYIDDRTKTGSAFEVENEISPKDVHGDDTSIVNEVLAAYKYNTTWTGWRFDVSGVISSWSSCPSRNDCLPAGVTASSLFRGLHCHNAHFFSVAFLLYVMHNVHAFNVVWINL